MSTLSILKKLYSHYSCFDDDDNDDNSNTNDDDDE